VQRAAVKAMEAGDDIVEFGSTGSTSGDLELAASTSNAVVAAVNSGALPKSDLVDAAAQVLAAKKVNLCPGYWLVTSRGNIFNLGNAVFYGLAGREDAPVAGGRDGTFPAWDGLLARDLEGDRLQLRDRPMARLAGRQTTCVPIVAIAPTPDGAGYWLVTARGIVYNFGTANWYGSLAAKPPASRIVAIVPTPGGAGYWLVTAKGIVYNFGTAKWYGSLAAKPPASPVVGMAAMPDGAGYWLVTGKRHCLQLRYCQVVRLAGGQASASAVTGIARTADGEGYWFVAADGNVYNFGGAGVLPVRRSTGCPHLRRGWRRIRASLDWSRRIADRAGARRGLAARRGRSPPDGVHG